MSILSQADAIILPGASLLTAQELISLVDVEDPRLSRSHELLSKVKYRESTCVSAAMSHLHFSLILQRGEDNGFTGDESCFPPLLPVRPC